MTDFRCTADLLSLGTCFCASSTLPSERSVASPVRRPAGSVPAYLALGSVGKRKTSCAFFVAESADWHHESCALMYCCSCSL